MKLRNLIITSLPVLALIGAVWLSPIAGAAGTDVLTDSCNAGLSPSSLCTKSQSLFGPNSIWTKIINTLIFVIGAVAVVMIVIGGFRYTISSGDQSQVNSAKNTILYAVIGLIIALMSYSVVNFVLARL